jgi:hypothetical protein
VENPWECFSSKPRFGFPFQKTLLSFTMEGHGVSKEISTQALTNFVVHEWVGFLTFSTTIRSSGDIREVSK